MPYDLPVVGYGGRTVNVLRLFAARSSDEFDMEIFNGGDYVRAVEQKIRSERVSKVLYPSDSIDAGRELRLVQEYFLVACAIRDTVRRYLRDHDGFAGFPDAVAIQLNDTHPALAVPELMRVLVDEYSVCWDEAWDVTVRTLGYTNHTLLPEALERWPMALLETVLPRHVQIIFEINRRFLEQVAVRWPGDAGRQQRMSIFEETHPRQVRMGHLSIVGSHSVNGVAAMHSELVKTELFPDFHELWPEKFGNKTNGVSPRRWLLVANPPLADLISSAIGDGWIRDLDRLQDLEPLADDEAFRERFMACKNARKRALADHIEQTLRVPVDPRS
ncbi:MAG: glycogen/starch/alpha-glucan phosphorylase, partial [Planctomycetota bacterium]